VRITSSPPTQLGAGDFPFGSGLASLVEFSYPYDAKALSDLLDGPLERRHIPSMTVDEGRVKLAWKDPCESSELKLEDHDDKLFATSLIRKLNLCVSDEDATVIEYNFSKPMNVGEIFFTGSVQRRFSRGTVVSHSAEVNIDGIEISKSDDNTKDISFPPGWTVNDDILHISYMTGATPQETLQSIRTMLKK
jgi:hypothetical protein